ncbi:hypothetical protein GOBAR_DD12119 [Gossypium barbadense]|nr:hypothetical protein GOBAR_DD12119 [Gossypium barbadense]
MAKNMGVAVAAALSELNVEKAVNALLKWRDSQSQAQKPQLLEQDEFLYLIVSLKKIPQKARVNPIKVPLPHPIIDDPAELCLFIDDRSKSGITKDAASKKIKSENIPINKVIKLSKLKTDYKPFEAKRKLCDSYDMFFADKRIIPLLPRLLGKQFFKKKKIPVPVDLKHNNWKEQIHNACSSAMLFLGSGTCCVVKVAKLSLEEKEIVENVIAAINGIAERVPSKWDWIVLPKDTPCLDNNKIVAKGSYKLPWSDVGNTRKISELAILSSQVTTSIIKLLLQVCSVCLT